MIDLFIIIFLVLFWVISHISKQSNNQRAHYKEGDELKRLFRFPELNIVPETSKQKDKKIEHIVSAEPKEQEEQYTQKIEPEVKKHPKISKTEPGKFYCNMLKSKGSLKRSIVIKDILSAPLSLR
jgi:NAD-specific glutamate dehydrogenase